MKKIEFINKINNSKKILLIFKNNFFLSKYLYTHKIENFDIINLSSKKTINNDYKKFNCRIVDTNSPLFYSKNDFINHYTNLIGEIGNNNNNSEWWASEISSKNRFTTNILNDLNKYVFIIKYLDLKKDNNILILCEENYILLKLIKKLNQLHQSKNYLNNYIIYQLMKIKNFFKIKFYLINFYFLNIKILISIMIKIIVSKIYLNHEDLLSLNTNKPNYLLKTHFFKNSFMKNSYHDVYFNQIIDKLKKKYNLVIYGHVHENYYYIINKINKNNLKNFYSIEYFLSFKDVILCFFKVLFYKIEFKNYYFFDIPVNSILKNEFRFSNISLYHLLIYYSLKNLTKKIKFQKSLMTYENISWENMFISSLKKFNQNVEILGYQHTVVPESACGMYTPLNEINIRPLPNRILTVGKETKKIIEKYSKFDPNNIIPTCALRFLHLFNHQRKRKKKIKNILIALEGVKGVENLVNYIFKNSNSHYNYLIRTHVELPWSYIKKNIKYNIKNFKNIKLSKNINIYDDLLESDCCIYWGSTVSIEALSLGIPIINYNNNSYLKYDPLFLFNDFKWETSDDRNLNNLLIEIDQLDHEKFIKKQDSAIKYLNNYFYDISDYNINYFL